MKGENLYVLSSVFTHTAKHNQAELIFILKKEVFRWPEEIFYLITEHHVNKDYGKLDELVTSSFQYKPAVVCYHFHTV